MNNKQLTEAISLIVKDQLLSESGLSRLYKHIQEHDCAVLTGWRNDQRDRSKCAVGALPFPKDVFEDPTKTNLHLNKLANRDIKAALIATGFGVTNVDGSYIENFNTPQQVEVSEDSVFVANLADMAFDQFVDVVASLGRKYCQDSVLVIPKGGQEAFLLGTNNSEFPGLDNRVPVGSLTMGKEAEFMTKVKNRPFTFTESLTTYSSLSRNERMAVSAIHARVMGRR